MPCGGADGGRCRPCRRQGHARCLPQTQTGDTRKAQRFQCLVSLSYGLLSWPPLSEEACNSQQGCLGHVRGRGCGTGSSGSFALLSDAGVASLCQVHAVDVAGGAAAHELEGLHGRGRAEAGSAMETVMSTDFERTSSRSSSSESCDTSTSCMLVAQRLCVLKSRDTWEKGRAEGREKKRAGQLTTNCSSPVVVTWTKPENTERPQVPMTVRCPVLPQLACGIDLECCGDRAGQLGLGKGGEACT